MFCICSTFSEHLSQRQPKVFWTNFGWLSLGLHGGCADGIHTEGVHHPGTPPYPSCSVYMLCLFS
jgi:hypothetical protein